ncbi:hypothetical protein CRYUN_Cryun05aG0037600 [Craigia yunnanensis]
MAANPTTVNPCWTRLVIQNTTANDINLFEQTDIHGRGPAPQRIQAYSTDEFMHTADNEGSIGGVAYQLGNPHYIWVFAWKNMLNENNKVYTRILPNFNANDRNDIFHNLDNAINKSGEDQYGYFASVAIDLIGNKPTVTAVLKHNPQ